MSCGPCANVACPQRLDLCVLCTCVGRTGQGLGIHSVFHPLCVLECTSDHRNSRLVLGPTVVAAPSGALKLTQNQVEHGRRLNQDLARKGADGQRDNSAGNRRWKSVRQPEVRRVFGMTALPAGAVLCDKCYVNAYNSVAREDTNAVKRRIRADVEAVILERLPSVIHRFTTDFLLALLALVTLYVWLQRGCNPKQKKSTVTTGADAPDWSKQKCVWFSGDKNNNAGAWSGGVVAVGGAVGTMGSICGALCAFGVSLVATPAVGLQAVCDALGRDYWWGTGAVFNARLHTMVTARVAAIQERPPRLHELSNYVDDWERKSRLLRATAAK